MSFLGVIQLVFIVLKFTEAIDWPWWIVLIPLWISIFMHIFGSND